MVYSLPMAADPILEIRQAQPGDEPTVLRLIKALAEYEKLAHQVVASETDLSESLFGTRPFAEAVIGYVDGEPVGFAVYFHSFSTFWGRPGLYLEDLFVEERWRGHGFGRRLLAYVARVAVERGCRRMEWAVLDWNEPTIAFYERLGARPMDDWTVFRLDGETLARVAHM
jgi:GNAT superfamily N-acetyltransferase